MPPAPRRPCQRARLLPLRSSQPGWLRCSQWRCHCSTNFSRLPARPCSAPEAPAPPVSLQVLSSILPDRCECPYTPLLGSFIGSSLNHSSHLRALIPVSMLYIPVTGEALELLPERETSPRIRFAIPNPPLALRAPARDSEANSPSVPFPPLSLSPSPVSEPLSVMGRSSSFIN